MLIYLNDNGYIFLNSITDGSYITIKDLIKLQNKVLLQLTELAFNRFLAPWLITELRIRNKGLYQINITYNYWYDLNQ